MTDFGTDELSDLTRLKKMREGGYFESEGSVPLPEIIADGDKSALDDLLAERGLPAHGQQARTYEHTSMFCVQMCQRLTQHGQVGTYNTGNPVFHCNICCSCHLCLERLAGAQRLYEAVNDIGNKLADWEAGGGVQVNPTFCPECGTALIGAEGEIRSGRCSACVSIEGGDAS